MSGRREAAGPWLAFGEEWFCRHQGALLALVNGPLRRWARWVLAIPPSQCPTRADIVAIGPNRYVVRQQGREFRACFYTHEKFSKRVYFGLRPLWWAMHGWDWAVADRWTPELSFGFSTLTAYPDPSPEVTTCDGDVWRWATGGESFSAIRSGAGTSAHQTSAFRGRSAPCGGGL
jgi:hypothetical protein